MNTIELIKQDPTYKEIMQDSFGGIMYNVANQDKYDTKTMLALWDSMTPSEQESAGGILKGAINFVKGDL